jgi:hypothetical protein
MQMSSSELRSGYVEAADSRNDKNTDNNILEGTKSYAHLFKCQRPSHWRQASHISSPGAYVTQSEEQNV